MATIGVRELKNQATEILREVRETRAEYIVTYRGSPVALLLPLDQATPTTEVASSITKATPTAEILAELALLRQKIGKAWKTKRTAMEAVEEQRQEA